MKSTVGQFNKSSFQYRIITLNSDQMFISVVKISINHKTFTNKICLLHIYISHFARCQGIIYLLVWTEEDLRREIYLHQLLPTAVTRAVVLDHHLASYPRVDLLLAGKWSHPEKFAFFLHCFLWMMLKWKIILTRQL